MKCPLCSWTAKSENSLRTHKSRVHQEEAAALKKAGKGAAALRKAGGKAMAKTGSKVCCVCVLG